MDQELYKDWVIETAAKLIDAFNDIMESRHAKLIQLGVDYDSYCCAIAASIAHFAANNIIETYRLFGAENNVTFQSIVDHFDRNFEFGLKLKDQLMEYMEKNENGRKLN